MLASSIATRCATTAFSEHVLTNIRYFCRLSKKRKLRLPGPAAGADCLATEADDPAGRRPGWLPSKNGRLEPSPAGAASAAMKDRTRSNVVVVIRPPSRNRLTNLPSLTAWRPKVDSATPFLLQKSVISRSNDSASTDCHPPLPPILELFQAESRALSTVFLPTPIMGCEVGYIHLFFIFHNINLYICV